MTTEQRDSLNQQIEDRRQMLRDDITDGREGPAEGMRYQIVKFSAVRDGLIEEFTRRYESYEENVVENFAREHGIETGVTEMETVNIVSSDLFNLSRVVGVHLDDLDDTIEWGSSYPIVGEDQVVVGIVDGNWPNEFNDGRWHIVGDYYAVADEEID